MAEEERKKEMFKLRKKGILSENDLALLTGNYKIVKGENRIVGNSKKGFLFIT